MIGGERSSQCKIQVNESPAETKLKNQFFSIGHIQQEIEAPQCTRLHKKRTTLAGGLPL